MKINFNISVLFCCFFWTTLWSQQPTYKAVGEDFLAEHDVFSLLQDEEDNIWISTDDGLFKYDGYKFSAFSCEHLKDKALYGLILDAENQIYCYNLEGEILRIIEDSIQVYYQIPTDLLGNKVSINFDASNRLFVSSKHFFYLDTAQQAQVVHTLNYTQRLVHSSNIAKDKEGQLQFTLDTSNHLATYTQEGLSIEENVPFGSQTNGFPRYMALANDSVTIAVAMHQASVYKKRAGTWTEISIDRSKELNRRRARCFLTKKNQLWFACENRGAYVYDLDGNALFYGHEIFSKHKISSLLEDREGNLWIGTFGKGLLIIPNLSVLDFLPQKLMQLDEIRTLAISKEEEVFLAGQSGMIYQVDQDWNIKVVFDDNKEPIDHLELFHEGKMLFFNDNWLDLTTGSWVGTTSTGVKEIKKFNEEEALLASNIGLRSVQTRHSSEVLKNRLLGFSQFRAKGSNVSFWVGRSNTVHYDEGAEQIWAGTSSGLKLIRKDSFQNILYEKQAIIANSIEESQDKIYVACQFGILVFDGLKLVQRISFEKGLLSDRVRKIKIVDRRLYVASTKGFQLMDLDQRTFLNFESSDGLLSNKILDFDVLNEQVWLVTTKGVQIFNPNQLLQNNYHPKISFTQLKINGIVSEFENGIAYPPSNNKIEFQFASKSYRNQEHFRYEYQMSGLSEDWEAIAYTNNSVLFNSLPPGNYRFSIKSVDDKGYESPIIGYNFSINRPFYLSLWFYGFCALGIALLVALFFVIRIRILERENKLLLEKSKVEKELLESRQVALRSQMNPHFLFNALNSIQEMIIVNDKRMASKFLGKFADLMRMYLNHSRQSKIKLSEELDALKLYLDLEEARFEDTLEIDWSVDPTLNPEFIEIPSMLIQPYVENALKHGLLHKVKNRVLSILVKKNKAGDMIHCIIEDNGVGRKRSAEINKSRSRTHQSFSTSATQKRLELLNSEANYPISVEMIDLMDEDQQALGTKVIISIPIK